MDLTEQKALIQKLWGKCPHDEPLRFFWERQRELSWNRPTFLKLAMRAANEIFLEQFSNKRSLDKSFRYVDSQVGVILPGARRPRFCSIKDFFNGNPDTFLTSTESLARFRSFVEGLAPPFLKTNESPPKGFVPLPDAEIGGCARNDSLIARIH
ncbi:MULTISPECIES: hypothetical protein [unclassified Microcoleus]|uniref:hypothetical protein n=1 Tax=unclassified Microcoleus TaxID=2642155 RepID=UPI002FD72B9D